MTNMEVNRMSEIYKVLEKLKSPAFKTHHWIQLLDEIYRDLTTKPDHSKITLRKLLEDRLMNFQPIINKLYNVSE